MNLQEFESFRKKVDSLNQLKYFNNLTDVSITFFTAYNLYKPNYFADVIKGQKKGISNINFDAIDELSNLAKNNKNETIEINKKEMFSLIFVGYLKHIYSAINHNEGADVLLKLKEVQLTIIKDNIIMSEDYESFKTLCQGTHFALLLNDNPRLFDVYYDEFSNYIKKNISYFNLQYIIDFISKYNELIELVVPWNRIPSVNSYLDELFKKEIDNYMTKLLKKVVAIKNEYINNIKTLLLYNTANIQEVFNFYRTNILLEYGNEKVESIQKDIKDYIQFIINYFIKNKKNKHISSILNTFISSAFKTRAWSNYCERGQYPANAVTFNSPWNWDGKINTAMGDNDLRFKILLYIIKFIHKEIENGEDVIKKYNLTTNNFNKILTYSII
jgi:hypothetical protein